MQIPFVKPFKRQSIAIEQHKIKLEYYKTIKYSAQVFTQIT